MFDLKTTLANWYKSENCLKFSISCVSSHLFVLLFSSKNHFKDARSRSQKMLELGLTKHPTMVFVDMLLYYFFFGYLPAQYSSYQFQNLSFKQRKTFIPFYEHMLFASSVNFITNENFLKSEENTYKYLKNYYGRDIITIKSEKDYKLFENFINMHDKFFYKSCKKNIKGVYLSNGFNNTNIRSVFCNFLKDGPFTIEEYIKQCEEMSAFNHSSVNTIRIVIFKSRASSEVLCGCLRCGIRNNIIDNGSSGGIFIPFNPENGNLYKMGLNEYGKTFIRHPDSNIKFEDFHIPNFEKLKAFSIEIADRFKGLKYLGMGIAISDNNKFYLLEIRSSPWLITFEGLHKFGFRKEFRTIARFEQIPSDYSVRQTNMK